MRILGFIMLPLLVFSCAAARSPEPESKKAIAKEQKIPEEGMPNEKAQKVDRKTAITALYSQRSLQLTCLAMFMVYFGMFAPIFYLPSFAAEAGFSTALTFYSASIVSGASFVGRILPGFVADKYGKFNCCVVATLSTGVIILCWTEATNVAGLVIWSAAYGFASGVSQVEHSRSSFIPLTHHKGHPLPATSLRSPARVPQHRRSRHRQRHGLDRFIASSPLPPKEYLIVTNDCCSAMANVPISGALAQKYGYLSLSLFSGLTVLTGGALLVAARVVQDRRLGAVV